MKIWEAELILIYNMEDKWEARFSFESDGKEYKLNESTKEWTNWEGWIGSKIPINMTVDRTYSGELKIVQGFDRELNSNELFVLEQEMRKLMVLRLANERESIIDKYKNKINAVLEGV